MPNESFKNKSDIKNSIKNLLETAEEFKNKEKRNILNSENINAKKTKTSVDNRLGIKDIKRIGDIKRKNRLKEKNLIDSGEVKKILYANITDMTRDLLKKWINNQLPYYSKKALSNDIKHLIKFHKNN